jgi:hypothetical protein
MTLRCQQHLQLADRQGHDIGNVVIDRIQGNLVFAHFRPGPDYARVGPLFAEYVEAANEQLLSVVGELDAAIAALGLHLRAANGSDWPAIQDVQIGDGIATFRIQEPSLAGPSGDQEDCRGLPSPPEGQADELSHS